MIFTPLEPKAGPTGGEGLAAPPLICNLIIPATSLAIFLLFLMQSTNGSFRSTTENI
jgi:hypothetical protein